MRKAFALSAFLITNSCGIPGAWAQPPANSKPELAPYFHELHRPQYQAGDCCSEADCRKVISRFSKNIGWEVFIDRATFGDTSGAPDQWLIVPNDALAQPTLSPVRPQEGVACWYQGQVRCFDPPLTEG